MNYWLHRILPVGIGKMIKMVFSVVFGIAVLSGCSGLTQLSTAKEQKQLAELPEKFVRMVAGEEQLGQDVENTLLQVSEPKVLEVVAAHRFAPESSFTNRVSLYKNWVSGMTFFGISYDMRNIAGGVVLEDFTHGGHKFFVYDNDAEVNYLFQPEPSAEKLWASELFGVELLYTADTGISKAEIVEKIKAKYAGLMQVASGLPADSCSLEREEDLFFIAEAQGEMDVYQNNEIRIELTSYKTPIVAKIERGSYDYLLRKAQFIQYRTIGCSFVDDEIKIHLFSIAERFGRNIKMLRDEGFSKKKLRTFLVVHILKMKDMLTGSIDNKSLIKRLNTEVLDSFDEKYAAASQPAVEMTGLVPPVKVVIYDLKRLEKMTADVAQAKLEFAAQKALQAAKETEREAKEAKKKKVLEL